MPSLLIREPLLVSLPLLISNAPLRFITALLLETTTVHLILLVTLSARLFLIAPVGFGASLCFGLASLLIFKLAPLVKLPLLVHLSALVPLPLLLAALLVLSLSVGLSLLILCLSLAGAPLLISLWALCTVIPPLLILVRLPVIGLFIVTPPI